MMAYRSSEKLQKADSWLKAALDYEFDDPALFNQALTHRSASGASNERLEFLGDAVLDLVVSEIVFKRQPDAAEGDLSRLRASLVKDTSLARRGTELGIGEFMVLGGGEKKTGGHRRESILADAVEALIGAVYLDKGFQAAYRVIEKIFGEHLVCLPDPSELRDAKTRLQEWLQAKQAPLPEYELVEVRGRAHKQTFEVRCVIAGVDNPAPGTGSSRRAAEQQSARVMLEFLHGSNHG